MIIYAFLLTVSSLLVTVATREPVCLKSTPSNCTAARFSHVAERAGAKVYMYDQARPGSESGVDSSRVCASVTTTCCSPEAEAAFELFARHEVERVLTNVFASSAKVFEHLNATFIALFHETFMSSRTRAIQIFKQAYQDYFSNLKVFDPLYDAMRAFTFTREADIDDAITTVRDDIIIEAFQSLTGQRISDERRKCILREINKAGESENDVFKGKVAFLRRLVGRAVNVSTALLIGLETGKRAIDLVSKSSPSCDCLRDYAQMSHCSLCGGRVSAKPCACLCETVIHGCVGDLTELGDAFDYYLEILSKILVEVTNISPESAIYDIGTEFSFGVMNLASSLTGDDGKRIQAACGLAGRRKRATFLFESWLADKDSESSGDDNESAPSPPSSMDFRTQLDYARKAIVYFSGSIGSVVNGVCRTVASSDDSCCWNGTDIGRCSSSKSKVKPDRQRARMLNSLRMELQRASAIMADWNKLEHWRTNPTEGIRAPECRKEISPSVKPTESPVTPEEDDDLPDSPECPEDDDDCGDSGSGDDLNHMIQAVTKEPDTIVWKNIGGAEANKPAIVRTVLISLILLAIVWVN